MTVALLAVTPSADGQAMGARWELTIAGPDMVEVGDLRLEGSSGRVLLQHADSAFQQLQDLRFGGGRISFSLSRSHRRFEGIVTATRLSGTLRDSTGGVSTWSAVPLSPASTRWPVPPRVVVRQLAMGSSATSERMLVAWLAAGPDSGTLEREYRQLANIAVVPPMTAANRAARASLLSLGLDDSGRAAAVAVLAHIKQGPAADPNFRAIFTRGNRWTLDIHDAVLWEAPHYLYGFQLARAADGLAGLHELDAAATDSAVIRQSAWRLWSNVAMDSVAVYARLDTLARHDEASANAVRALLAGFNDATTWWRRAVSWLLTHPWLDTPDGPRSPAQLMAAFWGVDSLPLPEIRDERFGDVAAMPLLSIQHIAPFLMKPANAIAAEWLPHGGAQDAFAVWRPLRWGESPPLTLVLGGRSVTVASPASQAIVHPAAFFGERDAIRIEPGIMPLAAVAAFLHEWNHLIAAERRLSGSHPVALVQSSWQLQLREEDPWLAEGFAEWATEEVLRPAGESAGFLRFTQSEKRLGIADADPNDPHVLGLRLVRGVARTHRAPVLRDLLVLHLHDLAGFARALTLPGNREGPAIVLQRPPTAAVIPEVTFTWDEGTAFDLSRRLVIPNTRSEH